MESLDTALSSSSLDATTDLDVDIEIVCAAGNTLKTKKSVLLSCDYFKSVFDADSKATTYTLQFSADMIGWIIEYLTKAEGTPQSAIDTPIDIDDVLDPQTNKRSLRKFVKDWELEMLERLPPHELPDYLGAIDYLGCNRLMELLSAQVAIHHLGTGDKYIDDIEKIAEVFPVLKPHIDEINAIEDDMDKYLPNLD